MGQFRLPASIGVLLAIFSALLSATAAKVGLSTFIASVLRTVETYDPVTRD